MTDIDDWEDRDELTDEELEEFKGLLLAERERVLDRLRKHIKEGVGDAENLPDETDVAKDLTDRAYLVRLADKERKLLSQIDHALAKFEEDDYGFCEGTGDLINPARLRLRPWTRYSIEYKASQERAKRALAGLRNAGDDDFGIAGTKRKKLKKREEEEEEPASDWTEPEIDDEVPIPDDDFPDEDFDNDDDLDGDDLDADDGDTDDDDD